MFFVTPHVSLTNPRLFTSDNLHLPKYLQCAYHNRTQLEYGRSHFARSRVIICGMIRDRENQIDRLRQQIESITKLFDDYAVVIVENDSTDKTRQKLIHWAEDKQVAGRVHVIGCGNRINDPSSCNLSLASTQSKAGANLLRIEKMVQLRNLYMTYLENNIQFANYEYILIQDFDLWSYTYIDGYLSTGFYLSTDPTIDAICANGIRHNQFLAGLISYKTYFDPYAHKDEFDQKWTGNSNNLWSSIFRYYSCNNHLIKVQSCFSGQTIYRRQSLKGKRYRTYLNLNQQPICEHVGLHETLENIYLNSEMIFYIMENNLS
ncbi:unnamed protein product [Adineta steineri]|uniref:Glycosyltransferase 2-like domain-containing protein n=1 Tax=Adineta steineri TaxID=433720 RepID=A0A819FP34_9BILA|nr:unnamed protein product [Adineta steineri]CAF3869941.1 unnamed protein product [Adineta steineri]